MSMATHTAIVTATTTLHLDYWVFSEGSELARALAQWAESGQSDGIDDGHLDAGQRKALVRNFLVSPQAEKLRIRRDV